MHKAHMWQRSCQAEWDVPFQQAAQRLPCCRLAAFAAPMFIPCDDARYTTDSYRPPPRSDATFPIQQASLLAGPQFPGRGWGVVESSLRPNPQGHSTKGDPVGPWSRTARHCVPGYPVHCWILIGSPPCQVRAMNKFPSRTLMIKLVYSIHSVHSCPPAYIMTGTMQFIDTCTTGIRKRRSL